MVQVVGDAPSCVSLSMLHPVSMSCYGSSEVIICSSEMTSQVMLSASLLDNIPSAHNFVCYPACACAARGKAVF